MVDTLHRLVRWVHVGFGFVGLAAFWVPVFAKKGKRLHVACGKVFAACAYVVAVSALGVSLWALADPISFFSIRVADQAPERLAALKADTRFMASILASLAVLLLSSVENGLGVVRARRDPLYRDLLRRAACIGLGVAGVGLLAAGAWGVARAGSGREIVRIALGAVLLAASRSRWKEIVEPLPTPMTWWYRHMAGMLGAGIAFHTAFAVFGSGRIFHYQLHGPVALVPWVLPSIVGAAGITIGIRYYKRKFNERATPRRAAPGMAPSAGD